MPTAFRNDSEMPPALGKPTGGKTYGNLLKGRTTCCHQSVGYHFITKASQYSQLKRSTSFAGVISIIATEQQSDQLNTQGLSKTAKAERIVPKLSSAQALKVAKTLEDLSESGRHVQTINLSG